MEHVELTQFVSENQDQNDREYAPQHHIITEVGNDAEMVGAAIEDTETKIDGIGDLASGYGDAFRDASLQLEEATTAEEGAELRRIQLLGNPRTVR